LSALISRPYTVPLTISGGDQTLDTASISERLRVVRERIASALERAGRPAGSVRLLAVTKGFSAETVRAAMALGLEEFGENRVQEAEPKIAASADLVAAGACWHLVGHLQSNKARRAAGLFAFIQSIDSLELAERLARVGEETGASVRGLVEVDLAGEASKFGLPEAELLGALAALRGQSSLRLEGLMVLPPLGADAQASRPYFRRLRELRDRALGEGLLAAGELSMGMSHDFEVAIEEGATLVRVGTAIFGERPPPA
jgi:pyridoxal phosphate enzyme (YggS family)